MPTAVALIHVEAGVYGISFPDFPGVISTGRSGEEVLRKGGEALNFHVSGMAEDGDALPLPRTLAELSTDRDYQAAAKDAVVALVPYDVPGRSVRINISMEENLITAVDEAAKAAGQSRSAYLAAAARARMRA